MAKNRKSDSNLSTHEWVLNNFPKNYCDLNYVEAICSDLSILLGKNKTQETLNFIDKGLYCIFKAIRDETEEFISRVEGINHQELDLQNALDKIEVIDNDYFEIGVHEFVIRNLSKSRTKKLNTTKKSKDKWEARSEYIRTIGDRIQNIVILNHPLAEVFSSWDDENSLMFINSPDLDEVDKKSNCNLKTMTIDDHINFLKLVINSKGKVVILSKFNSLYNKYLGEWDVKKRMSDKREAIWTNF